MRLRLILLLVLAGAAHAQDEDRVRRWACQVVLGAEFDEAGRKKEKIIRWLSPPTLSIHGGDTAARAEVLAALAELNACLATTPFGRIKLIEGGSRKAGIIVHLCRQADFSRIAAENGFKPEAENLGMFWSFWDDNRVITRAVVLLAVDQLKGRGLRHFALEEITQSLGLANDSPEFPDSIFYADGKKGGGAQKLSALDQALIRCLHELRSGDGQEELTAQLKKHGLLSATTHNGKSPQP